VLIIILCDVIADAANVKYENASLLTSDDDCTHYRTVSQTMISSLVVADSGGQSTTL